MCGMGGNLSQGLQGGVNWTFGYAAKVGMGSLRPGAFEKPFRFDNQTAPAQPTSTLSLYTCTSHSTSGKITLPIAIACHRTGHSQHCPCDVEHASISTSTPVHNCIDAIQDPNFQ